MKKEVWMAALSALLTGCGNDKSLTQEEQFDKMLEKLAKKTVPTSLDIGAMCYEIAETADRVEYVCPACGGKTILVNFSNAWWLNDWTLKRYREDVKKVKALGLDATLDERSWCETCRVNMESLPDAGELFLEVKIGEKTTRTKIEDGDFAKLIAFLEKKDKWLGDQDQEYPLNAELPRIRTLLGMPEPTKGK